MQTDQSYLNFTYTNKKSGATEKRPANEDNSHILYVQSRGFTLD